MHKDCKPLGIDFGDRFPSSRRGPTCFENGYDSSTPSPQKMAPLNYNKWVFYSFLLLPSFQAVLWGKNTPKDRLHEVSN